MNPSNINPAFEALLEYIKRNRGFDFTGYKRSSLMRRVMKQMQTINISKYADYIDYLEANPQEFEQLFNTLLINVTSFFRDQIAWDYLYQELIPQIVANKHPSHQIRVWSAACASGQEAYSLAIILVEVLGIDKFRERVKIYATDIDEEALIQARQATYSSKDLEQLPPEMVEKYFERVENDYIFRKDLRRCLIFGRHNLTSDAPMSRIDLLVCRNALIYFNSETQGKILNRFHFSLNDGGFLFLGKAEMLLSYSNIFMPVELKLRVFKKVPKVAMSDRLSMLSYRATEESNSQIAAHLRIREAAFETNLLAQIIVNIQGFVVLVNERARLLFGISSRDLNRPLQDLEISYRPVDLRSCIDQVYSEHRAVNIPNVERLSPTGEILYLDVSVTPLIDNQGILMGVSISFTDVTRYKQLQEELQQSNQELEMAYEELQSTNEELETTNEELQSSNEELETTNEELQSSNEELETMNEELQSTNEELETLNDELQRRSDELNEVNDFLEAILTSLRGGVIVLNQNLQVQVWNHKVEDLWGLRKEEVLGQHLLNLDIGLPTEQIRQIFRSCFAGELEYQEIVMNVMNRRGKMLQCQITCTPLTNSAKEILGLILIIQA